MILASLKAVSHQCNAKCRNGENPHVNFELCTTVQIICIAVLHFCPTKLTHFERERIESSSSSDGNVLLLLRKKKRRLWVHPILERRMEHVEFHRLIHSRIPYPAFRIAAFILLISQHSSKFSDFILAMVRLYSQNYNFSLVSVLLYLGGIILVEMPS